MFPARASRCCCFSGSLSKTGPSKAQNGLKTAPKGGFGALKAVSEGVFAAKTAKNAPEQAKPFPSLLSDGQDSREASPLARSLTIAMVLNVKSVLGFFAAKLPGIYRHKRPSSAIVAIWMQLMLIIALTKTLYHRAADRQSDMLPLLRV